MAMADTAYVTEIVYKGIPYAFWIIPGRAGETDFWILLVSEADERPSRERSIELFYGPLDWFRLRTTFDMWGDREGGNYAWFSPRKAKRSVSDGIKTVMQDYGPKFRKRWGVLEWDRKWHSV